MERTARDQVLYVMPQQAQKHVTDNEAICMIDALIQAAVYDIENAKGHFGKGIAANANPNNYWRYTVV